MVKPAGFRDMDFQEIDNHELVGVAAPCMVKLRSSE